MNFPEGIWVFNSAGFSSGVGAACAVLAKGSVRKKSHVKSESLRIRILLLKVAGL
jgi:hypothetical protein